MTSFERYFEAVQNLLQKIRTNEVENIHNAARACADTILKQRLVHLFGTGHSRVPVEEFFPRYGSFPGFHPIVELSLTYHNSVVGANGQRQAMFIENVSGLANRILRNFAVTADDTMIIFSSSGTNLVSIEMALEAKKAEMITIAVTSRESNSAVQTQQSEKRSIAEICDIVIDNGAPAGDAVIRIEGLEPPVAPVSTIGACFVANAIKAEVAEILTRSGRPPFILTSALLLGKERAQESCERSYDDYRRRISVLYK